MFIAPSEGLKVLAKFPTGSRFTCTPPVMHTDEDWLVLIDKPVSLVMGLWRAIGFIECTDGLEKDGAYIEDPEYGDTWRALRRDTLNVMVTGDAEWYFRAVGATLLCKHMNYEDKEDRKLAFRCVRDGGHQSPDRLPNYEGAVLGWQP